MVADYLDYFALENDPFSGDDDALFDGGGRDEQFAQCTHAAQFSTALLVVTGEEGSGKSAWAQALAGQMQSQDRVVLLSVPLLTDCEQLQAAIAEGLEIDMAELECTLSCDPAAGGLAQTHLVLLLDDAHHLDDESLAWLVDTVRNVQEQGCHTTHIALFGLPVLATRVATLARQLDVTHQHYALAPLSEIDTKAYLRWRLHAAGFQGPFPFSDDEIEHLQRASNGLPGRLHDLARQRLIGLAVEPIEERASRLGLPLQHMAAVVGLSALLVIVGLFWIDEEPAESMGATEEPLIGNIDNTENSANATALESGAANPVPPAVENPPIADSAAKPSGSSYSTAAPVAPEPVAELNTEPRTKPAPQPEEIASVLALPPSDLEIATPPIALDLPAPAPQFNQEERQLMALAEGYTIQILASASKSAVEDFIERQPDPEALKVYRASRSNGRVYIVVSGHYPSAELARLAIGQLPEQQRRSGPWPRTISGVQKDIESFHKP